MDLLLLSIQLIISLEFLILITNNFLPTYLGHLAKILSLLSSKSISEHFIEKVLPTYAIKNIFNTFVLIFIFVLSFLPFILEFILKKEVFALSKEGILFSIFFASMYIFSRSKLIQSSEKYSNIEKSLHYLILENSIITDFLFYLEKFFFSKRRNENEPDIYICGLARSGTTMILNQLYQTDLFYSLTYKDMPFILSPKTWRLFTTLNFKKDVKQQRAHKDGMQSSYSSPEAFEEVFWQRHIKRSYIKYNSLIEHHPEKNILENFSNYINFIKAFKRDRYLSKNNNNILRINTLSSHLAFDVFIVPFRSPLEQSQSLLEQHLLFNNNTQFETDYFRMLGHYEFGSNHKPFRFTRRDSQYQTDDINYWLEIWLDTYSYIIKHKKSNIHFISYEELCHNSETWSRLSQITSCHKLKSPEIINKKEISIDENKVSKPLLDECLKLHKRLNETF